jgi:hypothetical protein
MSNTILLHKSTKNNLDYGSTIKILPKWNIKSFNYYILMVNDNLYHYMS